MSATTFSKDWPKPCPPDDAKDTSGRIFRRTKKNPPSVRDLQSHFQRGTAEDFSPCGRCALSVLTDEADIEHSFRLFGHQGNYVFRADLSPGQGKMKPAGGPIKSHTNVWFYEQVNVESLFTFDRERPK